MNLRCPRGHETPFWSGRKTARGVSVSTTGSSMISLARRHILSRVSTLASSRLEVRVIFQHWICGPDIGRLNWIRVTLIKLLSSRAPANIVLQFYQWVWPMRQVNFSDLWTWCCLGCCGTAVSFTWTTLLSIHRRLVNIWNDWLLYSIACRKPI